MTADEMYEQYRRALFADDRPECDRLMQVMLAEEYPDEGDERETLAHAFGRAQDEHVAAVWPSLRRDIGNLAAREIDQGAEPSAAFLLDRIFFGFPADPDA